MKRFFTFLSSLALFVSCTAAQYAFTTPDGTVPDFDSSFTLIQGQTASLAWQLNATNFQEYAYANSNDPTPLVNSQKQVSLWVTSFKGQDGSSGYWKCLAPHIDTTTGGTFEWTVDLSDDDIDSHNTQFVYRLKPAVADVNTKFNNSLVEAPSRGFTILKKPASSPSSSMTSSSSIANAAATGSQTGAPDATTSPQGVNAIASNPETSSGISTGAIAGIVVGIVAAVGAIAGGTFFCVRRRRATARKAALANETAGFLGAASAGGSSGGHSLGYQAPPAYSGGAQEMSQNKGYAPASADQFYNGPAEMGDGGHAPVEIGHSVAEKRVAAVELA